MQTKTQHVQIQIKKTKHMRTHVLTKISGMFEVIVGMCSPAAWFLAWTHLQVRPFLTQHSVVNVKLPLGCERAFSSSYLWERWLSASWTCVSLKKNSKHPIKELVTFVPQPKVAWNGKSSDDHDSDLIAKPEIEIENIRVTLWPQHKHKPMRNKVIGIYGVRRGQMWQMT